MTRISSYIFMDLETTGFPWQENNQTRVTELAMVAVRRDQLLHVPGTGLGEVPLPRVLNKLVLCFRPNRNINKRVSDITGLDNQNLREETSFDFYCFETISKFVESQKKPVCFVVHNGNGFDYPILQAEFDRLKTYLPADVLCVDSLPMFREILKNDTQIIKTIVPEKIDDFNDDFLTSDNLQLISELESCHSYELQEYFLSPEKTNDSSTVIIEPKLKSVPPIKKKRVSFKLTEIYFRLFGKVAANAHRAEDDCIILMQVCMARAVDFMEWSEKHYVNFNDIPKMEVVLAIVIVAVLWGGTNPLIKIASKNITVVHADTVHGKIFKEFLHLFTNWKYMVPFLLNQSGSVIYVAALQHAELSLIVPVTNSLTFLFTALTGWMLGEQQPKIGTICGMGCILFGTMLCVMDRT